MTILRTRKKFQWQGIDLVIVEREEPYMNASEPITMTRVLAPNGGVIPVNLKRKQTLKSIVLDTISFLDKMEKMQQGKVKWELTEEWVETDTDTGQCRKRTGVNSWRFKEYRDAGSVVPFEAEVNLDDYSVESMWGDVSSFYSQEEFDRFLVECPELIAECIFESMA